MNRPNRLMCTAAIFVVQRSEESVAAPAPAAGRSQPPRSSTRERPPAGRRRHLGTESRTGCCRRARRGRGVPPPVIELSPRPFLLPPFVSAQSETPAHPSSQSSGAAATAHPESSLARTSAASDGSPWPSTRRMAFAATPSTAFRTSWEISIGSSPIDRAVPRIAWHESALRQDHRRSRTSPHPLSRIARPFFLLRLRKKRARSGLAPEPACYAHGGST